MLVTQLCTTLAFPWTAASQTPLSMEFSKQEYWSGLPFPSPGHLPDSGIEPRSLVCPALAGRFFTTRATWEGLNQAYEIVYSKYVFTLSSHMSELFGEGEKDLT